MSDDRGAAARFAVGHDLDDRPNTCTSDHPPLPTGVSQYSTPGIEKKTGGLLRVLTSA